MSTSEPRPTLEPLKCTTCNAPLVVVDAPSLICPFCATGNVIPQAYREELRLKRDLDSATVEAAAQWLRLARIKVPRWWFISVAIAPFVLMTGAFIILLTAALLRAVSASALPDLLAWVWLTLIPAQLLAAHVGMKNVLVSGVTNVGAAFAAIPPSAPGEPPNCRECGAALSVQPEDVLVRCLYCETESIVRLDELGMETLRTRVVSAQSSLAEAMSELMKHARLARLETRGRTYIIAALLILPVLWSFLESWNSSYWSLLIALDVFVLSVCLFWNVREALLLPVTLEDLERLLGSPPEPLPEASMGSSSQRTPFDELRKAPPDETGRRVLPNVSSRDAPGKVSDTRGWYDHAFERVNYVIPALVTLLFVTIQLTVLTRPLILPNRLPAQQWLSHLHFYGSHDGGHLL